MTINEDTMKQYSLRGGATVNDTTPVIVTPPTTTATVVVFVAT
jgi:hypothetical protein